MRGKFYIVNNIDRPSERLVAEKRADGLLYYIEKEAKARNPQAMESDRATDLVDFGFEFEETEEGILFRKVAPSSAKYHDGSHRDWQGLSLFIINKRTS